MYFFNFCSTVRASPTPPIYHDDAPELIQDRAQVATAQFLKIILPVCEAESFNDDCFAGTMLARSGFQLGYTFHFN
jgi:hypothetical protein